MSQKLSLTQSTNSVQHVQTGNTRLPGPATALRPIGALALAETAEEAGLRAETHHHGQAQILPRRHS